MDFFFETFFWVLMNIGLCLKSSASLMAVPKTVNVRLVIHNNTKAGLGFEYEQIRPGIEVAMKKAMDFYKINYEMTSLTYAELCTTNPSKDAVGMTDDFINLNKATIPIIFLAPACTADFIASTTIYDRHPIGPFVTGGGHHTTNPAALKGGIRIAYSSIDLWKPCFYLWDLYNWTNINIIYYRANSSESTQFLWERMKKAFQSALSTRENDSFPRYKPVPIDHIAATLITDNLKYARNSAQINVLLMDASLVRSYMLTARDLGMTDGTFVYFAVDLKNALLPANFSQGDGNDGAAKDAYRSLFVVTVADKSKNLSYKLFVQELADWYSLSPNVNYKFPNLLKNPSGSQAGYYLMSHHDAVLIPAIAARARLNSLEASILNISPSPVTFTNMDSSDWLLEISNKTYNFDSDQTRLLDKGFVDTDGNIQEFIDVYDLTNWRTGIFTSIGTYGKPGMTSAAEYTPNTLVHIDWANKDNTPPKNKLDETTTIDHNATIIGVSLSPIVLLFSVFLYRQSRKMYAKHKEMWTWVIEPKDLKVRWPSGDVTEGRGSDDNLNMSQSLSGGSMGSSLHASNDHTALVTVFLPRCAIWRRQLVILRHSFKKLIPLHKSLYQEVQFVRAMNHDNVLKFLRATVAFGHVAVVYEGVTRGTITDLIHSKSAMDWDVRYPFINDIINGMLYLYSKKLRCHGRLTSNCLFLDAQFVVKIGDYGLPSYFDLNVVELWFAKKDPAYFISLLWTPPEILKDFDSGRLLDTHLLTRFVDVFSFGIILQELILWQRPYGMFPKLTSKEITTYVSQGQNADGAQMRPRFDLSEKNCNLGLIELAQRCWSENQYDRPDWIDIRARVNETQKTMGVRATGSVLDSLVEQLEELTETLADQLADKEAKIYNEEEIYFKTLMLFVPRRLTTDVDKEVFYPTKFQSVTVVCSDLLTPTVLLIHSTPAEVIQCVNSVFEVVSRTIAASPLTKLTQLLDTVIAVAGIPENKDNHAEQTAKYALDLLQAISECRLPNRPDLRLRPRIAFTSGTLVGGIMETPMPRFFVYGEPVRKALRLMYSMGQVTGILIGESSKELLEGTEFVTEPRGFVPFHKDGRLMSYWLHGTKEQLAYKFSVDDAIKSVVLQRPNFLIN